MKVFACEKDEKWQIITRRICPGDKNTQKGFHNEVLAWSTEYAWLGNLSSQFLTLFFSSESKPNLEDCNSKTIFRWQYSGYWKWTFWWSRSTWIVGFLARSWTGSSWSHHKQGFWWRKNWSFKKRRRAASGWRSWGTLKMNWVTEVLKIRLTSLFFFQNKLWIFYSVRYHTHSLYHIVKFYGWNYDLVCIEFRILFLDSNKWMMCTKKDGDEDHLGPDFVSLCTTNSSCFCLKYQSHQFIC